MAFKSWKDVDETAYGRKLAEENKAVQATLGRAADFVVPGRRALAAGAGVAGDALHRRAGQMRANLGKPPREMGLPGGRAKPTAGVGHNRKPKPPTGLADDPGVAMTDMKPVALPKYARGGAPHYDTPDFVRTDSGRFEMTPGAGGVGADYRGKRGSMAFEGPGQKSIGGRGVVDGKTMERANQNIRGGGNTGYGLSVSRGPGGAGLSDAQWSGMSNQDRINANVSSFEEQTAAIRDLRNAQRKAQGLPEVGTRRATGPVGSWSQQSDLETDLRNSQVGLEGPKDRRQAAQDVYLNRNQALDETRLGNQAAAERVESDRQYDLQERGQAQDYQLGLADLDYKREAGRRTADQALLMKDYDHMLDLSKKEFQAGLDANKELSQEQRTRIGKEADAGYEMIGQAYPLDALTGDEDGGLRKGNMVANQLYSGILAKAAQENRKVSPRLVASLLLQGMQGVEEGKMSESGMPAWLNEQLGLVYGNAP